jgi:hypothetical protein
MRFTCPACRHTLPCAYADPLTGQRYRLQPDEAIECGLCGHVWKPFASKQKKEKEIPDHAAL